MLGIDHLATLIYRSASSLPTRKHLFDHHVTVVFNEIRVRRAYILHNLFSII